MNPHVGLRSEWPLVGRDDLLATITSALKSSATSVVVLCGPSGVGKTRLAAQAAAQLEADGWLGISVAANETISAIPLGALSPALAIARLELEAVGDSAALFDQARRSLEKAAIGRKVVIVVDDLSLLDSLSLAVITQLLAAGTIRLIATVRSGEPIPDPILSMWTGNAALRLDVPPLTVAQYESILAEVLGSPATNRTAADLHRMSGGNPLFLRELVIGAVDAGHLTETDGVWQLLAEPMGTPALHDLIRWRLRHLDADSLALVERIAVCQPLAIGDLEHPAARGHIVELERAGLVTVTESGSRLLVALAHPQYVAAVRASLSRLRTIDLLLDQADRVAARLAGPGDELRIATWRLDAGHPSDPDLLLRAAHLAVIAQDFGTVARLAAAAIEAGAPVAELLLIQGHAVWTLGRGTEASALLARAAAADQENPTTLELTGEIARTRASVLASQANGNAQGIEVLDEVTRRHPELAPALALSRSVMLLNLEEAELSADQVAVAEPAGVTSEQRDAVLAHSIALPLSALGKAAESIAAARAAVAFASSDDRPPFSVRRAQMVLATALLQAGEASEARALTIASLHDGMRHEDELTIRYNEFMLGRNHFATGRLDTAARWFRDTITGAQSRGPIVWRDQAKAYLGTVLAWQGKIDAATSIRAELDEVFIENNSNARLLVEWLAAVTGDRDGATARLIDHAEHLARRGHRVLAANLLHAASRLGAASDAAPGLANLARESDSAHIARQSAHASAEAADDIAALTAAAEAWESAGYLLFGAEGFASAASLATRADRARDAAALRNRADRLVAQCEGAATPALQFATQADSLTRREREIAALAAQGLTSQEIAQRLFLSTRTVNNHLQATYTKLGIRGRGELSITQ